MKTKFIEKTPYQLAFDRWFSEYESERRRRRKRPGSNLADWPAPPTHPEEVAQTIDRIGRARVLSVLGIHRTTLARWTSGEAVIPRPAWLLLVLMAEGRLPGMSEDWRQFQFDGDRLHIVGTRYSYSALEIAGWHYQQAHAAALARHVQALEGRIAHLLDVGEFGAANDALMAAV